VFSANVRAGILPDPNMTVRNGAAALSWLGWEPEL